MPKRFATDEMVQLNKVGRSLFDLSYAKKLSGKMGYLYPVMVDEAVPGDVWDLGAEAVVRFAPMVAPVLHEIILKADWFFVPYRILGNTDYTQNDGLTQWERFITGGQAGTSAETVPRMTYAGPTEGTLADHLGFVPGLTLSGDDRPLAYPLYAYNRIYNEYYRDPNLESIVAYNQSSLLTSNWDADYFTRALPWQQRGTAPALPVTGTSSAVFDQAYFVGSAPGVTPENLQVDNDTGPSNVNKVFAQTSNGSHNVKGALDHNVVDLSTATSVNIADLRLAVQLQKWLERTARTGYRYTEVLRSHFGDSPRDERLDRPEYIGGMRQSVAVSEVLQTSQTGTTPQGYMAGHGILAGKHGIGRYHVREFGLIMCLMSIQPRSAYMQGINRQWLRKSKYDFYWPEFAHLAEQAIYNEEIYAQDSTANQNLLTWGYQGRYDEMRSKQDMVAGAFRSTLDYWTAARKFASLPALSSTFGHVDPASSACLRMFAAQNADTLYVHWGNRIRAIRPLPPYANPGYMDHF